MDSILKISEAAGLGLHAMIHLAGLEPGNPVAVGEIAEKMSVSENHLAKVMQRLNRANLTASKKGPKGGFFLKKAPEDITFLDIYEAVEGPLPSNFCLLPRRMCQPGACVLGNLLQEVYQLTAKKFGETTLADFSPITNKTTCRNGG